MVRFWQSDLYQRFRQLAQRPRGVFAWPRFYHVCDIANLMFGYANIIIGRGNFTGQKITPAKAYAGGDCLYLLE